MHGPTTSLVEANVEDSGSAVDLICTEPSGPLRSELVSFPLGLLVQLLPEPLDSIGF